MIFWWYFHSLLSAGIFSLTSWDGLQTLFLALHSQLSWTEYHFSSQHYKILITNVSRYTSYEVEGLADLTRPDPDLEVMRRSTIVLAYLSLLASSRVHPYFSIPLSLNIWKSLFSSMYVTACISGHRIIFVWSWKKLIWKKKQHLKQNIYILIWTYRVTKTFNSLQWRQSLPHEHYIWWLHYFKQFC